MSDHKPPGDTRRVNGILPSPASQRHEPVKGRASGESGGTGRAGRARGSSEKHGDGGKPTGDSEISKPVRVKQQNDGEKMVVRRLPPAMTESEFITILGPEWESGKGKVDWFNYVSGKVSKDPSKPSRPARAYFHLTRKDNIMPLSEVVRNGVWEDAKGTFTNPSLIGPPCLEVALYKKVPSNKKRADTRQGTIDQDPEFMAFLEALANPPLPKEGIDAEQAEDALKVESKITTTPLVEYLKEKKANKTKDAGSQKGTKHGRQESGTSKAKASSKDEDGTKKKGRESKAEKSEKPVKETVKILTKKTAIEQAAEAAKNVAAAQKSSASAPNPPEALKSRRADIAAAARILQRDLGLSPGSAHRRARQDAAKADADTKAGISKDTAAPATERPISPAPSTESAQQASKTPASSTSKAQGTGRRNRGAKNAEKGKSAENNPPPPSPANPPVILKKKGDNEKTKPAAAASANTQEKPTSKPSSTTSAAPKGGSGKGSSTAQKKATVGGGSATRGFVKHVNASQGVTEALLREALGGFGTITFIEVDKRKGFAYVDFAEHDSLAKAISSSPITVGQGTVQVMERKEKKPAAVPAANPAASPTGAPSGANSDAPADKTNSGRNRRGRGGGGKGAGGGNNATNAQNNTAAAASSKSAG
ncbi:hypothetical protein S40288_06411 [Stachybotrys chartarum IBT 40288]|nr:hypothetical protein S40288_06411 [Stachybotrys chartarum IBT 40288]